LALESHKKAGASLKFSTNDEVTLNGKTRETRERRGRSKLEEMERDS